MSLAKAAAGAAARDHPCTFFNSTPVMRRSQLPIGRIGYLHRSGRFRRDAEGVESRAIACPGCRISETPSRHFPGRTHRGARRERLSRRHGQRALPVVLRRLLRQVTSPSGGYTSGRSTRDSTQNYNVYNVGNSSARIVTETGCPGCPPGSSRCDPRPAPTRTTVPRSSRRRPSPVVTRARRGGTAGGRIFRVRHRTGGTGVATGTTSPSSPARTTSRRRWRSESMRPTAVPRCSTQRGMPFQRKRILAKLRYGHWFHFLVHARWSTGSDGFVEMWLDGKRAIRRVHGATLRNQNAPASSEVTESRDVRVARDKRHAYRSTNTVIHDGFRRALSRQLAEVPGDTPAAPETVPRLGVDGTRHRCERPLRTIQDLTPALWRAR